MFDYSVVASSIRAQFQSYLSFGYNPQVLSSLVKLSSQKKLLSQIQLVLRALKSWDPILFVDAMSTCSTETQLALEAVMGCSILTSSGTSGSQQTGLRGGLYTAVLPTGAQKPKLLVPATDKPQLRTMSEVPYASSTTNSVTLSPVDTTSTSTGTAHSRETRDVCLESESTTPPATATDFAPSPLQAGFVATVSQLCRPSATTAEQSACLRVIAHSLQNQDSVSSIHHARELDGTDVDVIEPVCRRLLEKLCQMLVSSPIALR